MKRSRIKCKNCAFYQERQGKGTMGDCKVLPLEVEKKPTDWCGQHRVNLDKYHVDGKKIYTRIDTRQVD